MTSPSFWTPLKEADRPALGVILLTLAAMVAYAYLGTAPAYDRLFGVGLGEGHSLYRGLWPVGAAFLLLGLVPVVAALLGGARPAALGLCLGDWRFGLKAIGIALPLVTPILYVSALDRAFQVEYPLAPWASRSAAHFVAWAGIYLAYYIGWESGFRGVQQIWLGQRIGPFPALLVQTATSTLLHIGKPMGETFAALLAGPLFGLLALRTGSVLWLIVLHWLIGVLNDLLCVLRSSGW
jgi:membrane protease YdiL (CAAX protease family)